MATTSTINVATITATGQALNPIRGGYLQLVNLTANAGTATVTIWDNAGAASGRQLLHLSAPAGWSICLPIGNLPFINGLWCVIGGAPTAVDVYYE